MDLLDIFAKISLDTSEYESGIDDAEATAEGFGNTLGGGLKAAGSTAATALAAAGAAAVAVGGAMFKSASATAEYGDKIDKASQKLGISSTAYQEWEAVLQHSGTSMDSMGASFKKLAVASQDASADQVAAFERIGLSMEEVQSMSTEDLWAATISGLQGMGEGAERTAVATELLGKGAMELGPLLNTSAEDTQAMIDRVNELGGVMSADAVGNAAAFQDSLQDLNTAFGGVKNQIGGAFIPILTKLLTFLATGIGKVGSFISSAVEGFNNFKSTVVDVASSAMEKFESLKTTVSDAMDKIKGLMRGELKFPHIKVPHFHITGGVLPWGIGGAGTPPKVTVEWYKKAMDSAMVLDSPTIFGASGNHLLGGGEAGREIISGEEHLMDMISAASGGRDMVVLLGTVINLMERVLQKMDEDRDFYVDGRSFGRAVRAYG